MKGIFGGVSGKERLLLRMGSVLFGRLTEETSGEIFCSLTANGRALFVTEINGSAVGGVP